MIKYVRLPDRQELNKAGRQRLTHMDRHNIIQHHNMNRKSKTLVLVVYNKK